MVLWKRVSLKCKKITNTNSYNDSMITIEVEIPIEGDY